MVGIIIVILLIIIIVVCYKIFIKNKIREDKCKLYKDWVIAVDISEEEKTIIRFCFILEILKNGNLIVRVPSLNDDKFELVWVPDKNNFYFKNQLKLTSSEDPSETV